MSQFLIPVTIAIVIFLSNLLAIGFFGKKVSEVFSKFKRYLVPFALGFSAVLLLTYILPRIFATAFTVYKDFWLVTALGAGFILFLLVEKLMFRDEARDKLPADLKFLHTSLYFMMSVLAGIVLFSLFFGKAVDAYMFAVPLFVMTLSGNISLNNIAKSDLDFSYILVSLAVPLGLILALVFIIPEFVLVVFYSIVTGWILFAILHTIFSRKLDFSFFNGVVLAFLLEVALHYLL